MSQAVRRALQWVRDFCAAVGGLAVRNARVVIVALAAVVVLWMLEELGEGEIMRIDVAAHALFVDALRSDGLTLVMQAVTDLATPAVLIVVLLAAASFAPGRRPGIAMAVNLAGAFALNQALKFLIQRPRPDGFQLVVESGYSFPSGHSMVAMAFYGFIVYLVWHYEGNRALRWARCILFSLLIVWIGVSRIYLGVHYASDVVAGLLISLAWLAVFTKVFCPVLLGEVPARPAGGGAPSDAVPPVPDAVPSVPDAR